MYNIDLQILECKVLQIHEEMCELNGALNKIYEKLYNEKVELSCYVSVI